MDRGQDRMDLGRFPARQALLMGPPSCAKWFKLNAFAAHFIAAAASLVIAAPGQAHDHFNAAGDTPVGRPMGDRQGIAMRKMEYEHGCTVGPERRRESLQQQR